MILGLLHAHLHAGTVGVVIGAVIEVVIGIMTDIHLATGEKNVKES